MMAISRADSEQYKSSLRTVTDKWPVNPHDYTSAPGTQAAYDEMGKEVLDRMRQEGIPASLDTHNAQYGFSIIPRFVYAGAVAARRKNFSLDELSTAMSHPSSFTTLQLPTREQNSAAVQIEFETGLNTGSRYSNVGEHIDEYAISPDTGLTIPKYPIHRYKARARLYDEGRISLEEFAPRNPDRDPVRCEAHKGSGILALGYRSILAISIADSNLFEATLNS